MNYDRPELLERLAAAYVFGTLSGRARRRFARLRQTLPAAEAAVAAWEARSAPLAQVVPEVAPGPQVWDAIERRIGAAPASERRPRRWWQPVFAFALGVFALGVTLRLYPPVVETIVPQAELPTKGYVGVLVDDSGAAAVLASSARHGRQMFVKILRPVPVPPGKVLQLWALPADGAPFPLGVVPGEGTATFEMAATSEELLAKVPRLAVSLEDSPAQPGDAPSPFVASGHCVKLW